MRLPSAASARGRPARRHRSSATRTGIRSRRRTAACCSTREAAEGAVSARSFRWPCFGSTAGASGWKRWRWIETSAPGQRFEPRCPGVFVPYEGETPRMLSSPLIGPLLGLVQHTRLTPFSLSFTQLAEQKKRGLLDVANIEGLIRHLFQAMRRDVNKSA